MLNLSEVMLYTGLLLLANYYNKFILYEVNLLGTMQIAVGP
jgi:hypothetical protein